MNYWVRGLYVVAAALACLVRLCLSSQVTKSFLLHRATVPVLVSLQVISGGVGEVTRGRKRGELSRRDRRWALSWQGGTAPFWTPRQFGWRGNRSLTKEEIHSFWKDHSKSCDGEEPEEQVLSPTSTLRSLQGGGDGKPVGRKKYSLFWQGLEKKSKASSPRSGGEPDSPVGADKVTKLTGDWWTRSNWAFLNEPPHEEMEDSSHRYMAQFHVAKMATATEKQLS